MKTGKLSILVISFIILTALQAAPAPPPPGIEPEALIERIIAVQAQQRSEVTDVILDARYVEGKKEKDGSLTEDRRFVKKVYMKYLPDTTWYHEDYLEYYKKGELQDPDQLEKEAAKRIEKKKKRGSRDISYPVLSPFYPENRDQYDIAYMGVTEDRIDNYVCHHFRVDSKAAERDHINGDFYFDAGSFNPVRIDFSPAKLVRKFMFKLNRLQMSISYGPTPEGWWFPRRFEIEGKGKAAFFIGVKFAATEYYSSPVVNTGIQAKVFEADDE